MRDSKALLRQALIPLLSLSAGIGLLALLIYWIRGWLHDNEDSAGSTQELLAEYRELNRRGELTDEEYRSIKSQMLPSTGQTARATEGGALKPLQTRNLLNDSGPRTQVGETNDPVPPTPPCAGEPG